MCCIRVQCKDRTELQEPKPSPGCPRKNGYFHPEVFLQPWLIFKLLLLKKFSPNEPTYNLMAVIALKEPEKCNEYTTCVDGNPTPGKCSTGVVWSPTILACTTPAQVGLRPASPLSFKYMYIM